MGPKSGVGATSRKSKILDDVTLKIDFFDNLFPFSLIFPIFHDPPPHVFCPFFKSGGIPPSPQVKVC